MAKIDERRPSAVPKKSDVDFLLATMRGISMSDNLESARGYALAAEERLQNMKLETEGKKRRSP